MDGFVDNLCASQAEHNRRGQCLCEWCTGWSQSYTAKRRIWRRLDMRRVRLVCSIQDDLILETLYHFNGIYADASNSADVAHQRQSNMAFALCSAVNNDTAARKGNHPHSAACTCTREAARDHYCWRCRCLHFVTFHQPRAEGAEYSISAPPSLPFESGCLTMVLFFPLPFHLLFFFPRHAHNAL